MNKKKRNWITVLALTGIVLILVFWLVNYGMFLFFKPTSTETKQGEVLSVDSLEIVTQNLDIPWEIAFLPNGQMLVTERPGNLIIIDKDKKKIKVAGVKHIGEGGLMGLAVDPNFTENNFIYLYMTSESGERLENRVEKYKLENNELKDKQVIISGIPGARYHDGGEIVFGPDGALYVTTGDAGNEKSAQDLNYRGGKVLRIKDGGVEIYSYGHRNSQGLCFDNESRLWATEHGRSGVKSGMDELNLIGKGKNYGWPEIEGSERKDGMETPVINSGAKETWAPAGIACLPGKIIFSGLRGESLYVYNIASGETKAYLRKEIGRIRSVAVHEGYLYFSTSNRDGRGSPREEDDKVYRISVNQLV
ncbi:MAG: PQQ-dependent sugar dehydrogenase [Nanoarchaeota archaeon]|nr:PQQ-dependent sugar dehydrogenase [Nanoarchaeota archaeon]